MRDGCGHGAEVMQPPRGHPGQAGPRRTRHPRRAQLRPPPQHSARQALDECNGARADPEEVASAPTGNRHTSSHRGILDIGPGDHHLSEIPARSSRKLATRRASQTPGHPGASLMPTSHTPTMTPHIAGHQRNVDHSAGTNSKRSVATRPPPRWPSTSRLTDQARSCRCVAGL